MSIGIGIAGSGLLVFYYIGAMQVLSQTGIFNLDQVPMGGLSGGAITALQTCAGVPFDKQFQGFSSVIKNCHARHPNDPYCGGHLGVSIQQAVLANIWRYGRHDAHARCSGRVSAFISVLNPTDTTLLNPRSWAVSNFTSLHDFIAVVGSTDYLSCFMAPRPYTIVRGKPAIDGGYTTGFEQLCPPSAGRCIKLSAFHVGPNNPTGKEPACQPNGTQPILPGPTSSSAAHSPSSGLPRHWKLPSTCTYDASTKAITGPQQPPFVPADNPDIFPGNPYNALKHDPCLWQSWSMSVLAVTPNITQAIYDQGAADATAWLAAQPR